MGELIGVWRGFGWKEGGFVFGEKKEEEEEDCDGD